MARFSRLKRLSEVSYICRSTNLQCPKISIIFALQKPSNYPPYGVWISSRKSCHWRIRSHCWCCTPSSGTYYFVFAFERWSICLFQSKELANLIHNYLEEQHPSSKIPTVPTILQILGMLPASGLKAMRASNDLSATGPRGILFMLEAGLFLRWKLSNPSRCFFRVSTRCQKTAVAHLRHWRKLLVNSPTWDSQRRKPQVCPWQSKCLDCIWK